MQNHRRFRVCLVSEILRDLDLSRADIDPPGPLVPVTKETYQPLFDLAATLKLTEPK